MDGLTGTFGRWQYLARIWQLRYFWLSLVQMDLKTRYRRSYLGIGWSLFRPVAMSVVFCLVFCKLFNADLNFYAPFVLCGLTVWQFLYETIIVSCRTFIIGGPYIRQQPLPLAIFPLRTVLGVGFHSLIALFLAIAASWFFNGLGNLPALVSLVPAVVLLFFLGWALAVIFGLAYTHFPDTQHMMEILLQVAFYLTPILYPPEMIKQRARLSWLIDLNPVSYILEVFRQPILHGVLAPLEVYAVVVACTLLTGLLAITCLKKLERTLVFWL